MFGESRAGAKPLPEPPGILMISRQESEIAMSAGSSVSTVVDRVDEKVPAPD
jgi:hypothetical protein